MEEQRTEGLLAVVSWCRRDLEAPWADTGPSAQLLAATHSGLAAEALVLNVSAVSQHSICSGILDTSCVLLESRYLPLKSWG